VSPVLALALARVACGAVLLGALYAALAGVVERREARQTAFGLLCFSSGLGWIALFAVGGEARPWDLWVPESNTFLTLLAFPHFAFAMAAMTVTLVGWYQAIRTDRWGPAAWATLAAFLLAWVHPFDLPVVLGTGVGWALLQGGAGLRFVAPGALSATAVVAYLQFGVISANPVFRAWVDQGDMTMSDPVPFLLGLGLLLPLAAVGLRSAEPSARLFGLWALVTTVLLFLPVSVSRRFVEGLHVPLAILGAFGWLGVRDRLQRAGLAGRLGAGAVVTGLVASTALVWLRFLLVAVQAPRPFFVSAEEMALVRALDSEAPSVVLSSYAAGNRIPAFTHHTVVVGHWHQTIDVHAKNEAVRDFFSDASAAERRELVRTTGVELLFVGPDERALGDYDPASDPVWEEVFANGAGATYRWIGAR
jgi:hypothetical protein